jgi:hypothetical protein
MARAGLKEQRPPPRRGDTLTSRRSNPELARADLTAAVTLSADRGLSAPVDRPRLNEAIGQRRRRGVD